MFVGINPPFPRKPLLLKIFLEMKNYSLLVGLMLLFLQKNLAQVVISTDNSALPHASAMLDVQSVEKGLLVPRMPSLDRQNIANPALGLLVFDTTTETFWFFDGAAWVDLGNPRLLADSDKNTKISVEQNPNDDKIRFNVAGTEYAVLDRNVYGNATLHLKNSTQSTFIGDCAGILTTPSGLGDCYVGYHVGMAASNGAQNTAVGTEAFSTNTDGAQNVAIGSQAMKNNTGGSNNTAVGFESMRMNQTSNWNTALGYQSLKNITTGQYNVALGATALTSNTTGERNVAVGHEALFSNTTGAFNAAAGSNALYQNTSGMENTAFGQAAIFKNAQSNRNTAVGTAALFHHVSGERNTAIGWHSLSNDSLGWYNTAIGEESMLYNIEGSDNVAIGSQSLKSNLAGMQNVAVGQWALLGNITGDGNTAVGSNALMEVEGSRNTAAGFLSLQSLHCGGENVAVGYRAADNLMGGACNNHCTYIGSWSVGENGKGNQIALGYQAHVYVSNAVRVGNEDITEIGGYEDWTNVSDGRFKNQVAEDVRGLDFILKLRPVTYHLDVEKLAQFNHTDEVMDTLGQFIHQEPDADQKQARALKSAIKYSGFIAQEVETAANEAGYDFSGIAKPQNEKCHYGLRYAQFTVPLVKAVQEQQAEIEALKKGNEDLKIENQALKTQFAQLRADLDALRNH